MPTKRKYNRQKNFEQYIKRKTENPALFMYKHIRWKCLRKGIPFDIEPEDIIIPEACPMLGIPLHFGKGTVCANSPTVDRIDSTKGYIKGNVQVLSHRANSLKNNMTLDELEKLYQFLKR